MTNLVKTKEHEQYRECSGKQKTELSMFLGRLKPGKHIGSLMESISKKNYIP